MLTFPEINPVAFSLGPLSVHWYGLMYLIGFLCGWVLLTYRIRCNPSGYTQEQVSDILFYTALGIIIGGRVGYMVFYAWPDLLANPMSIVQVWKGGMSFHGGFLGVLIALTFYARKIGKTVLDLTDLIAPMVPIGLGAGRIGNFINSELWGRVTDMPWGMVFPNAGLQPRHPSQLYEFLLEGVVMFVILWMFSSKPRPRCAVSGLFLVCYGVFRFAVEYVREPDAQIGYLAWGWLTEGQLLSLPMIAIGIGMLIWAYRGNKSCNNI